MLALSPDRFLRSVDASRDTLGKPPTKLFDLVEHVTALTGNAPYAVIGGLAQIRWARKTHTDDIDFALASSDLSRALERVTARNAGPEWRLPSPPDHAHEENAVFEVAHLLHDGAVVDLIAFKATGFTDEILATARPIPELRNIRFIAPELLLVTHLLRPGAHAALAAVELIVSRRAFGGIDEDYVKRWADLVGKREVLARALARADDLAVE